MEDWLKWIPLIATLATLVIGVYKYSDHKKKEFRKEFWDKRFEFYEEAIGLASTVAVAQDFELVQLEISEFRKMYWGKMSMIEDKQVLDAMVAFKKELDLALHDNSRDHELKFKSYDLARACRVSLKETWEPVKLDDIRLE